MMELSTTENKQSGLSINKKTVALICILLVAIMAFAGVLTQVLPRGVYETNPDGTIINGTYTQIEDKLPIWKIALAPILVFGTETALTGVGIVLIITLIGGTFLILDKCNVLKYIMATIINKFGSKKYILLNVMIFACMVLSSTAGILEESVTLVPIAVAISLALGWDSFVGLGMSLIAVAFGFTAATFNPFNVVTVQRMANIPVFSGINRSKHAEHHHTVDPHTFGIEFPFTATTQMIEAIQIQTGFVSDVMQHFLRQMSVGRVSRPLVHGVGNQARRCRIGLIHHRIYRYPIITIAGQKIGIALGVVCSIQFVQGITQQCFAPHPLHFRVPGGSHKVRQATHFFVITHTDLLSATAVADLHILPAPAHPAVPAFLPACRPGTSAPAH